MNVRALLLRFAVVFPAAYSMARLEAASGELVEKEVRYGNTVVTLVKYGDQLYRKIEVEDLKRLAVDGTRLPGLLVCVEGKFDKVIAPRVFRLIGSNTQMCAQDERVFADLMDGDNIWVSGRAEQMPRQTSCYLMVTAVVRLKPDKELFQERFAKHAAGGNWKALIELGRWIENCGKLAETRRFASIEPYRGLQKKAFRQALGMREQEVGPKDADGMYDLGRMYIELLGRVGRLPAEEWFRKAIEIDPDHKKVGEALQGMGYVRFEGKWMDAAEREQILSERRVAVAVTGQKPSPDEKPTPEATGAERPVLSGTERLRRLLQFERAARQGEGLAEFVRAIPQEDEFVARRMVWVLANVGGPVGAEGVVKATASSSPGVRRDAVDALAWRGDLENLAEFVRKESFAKLRAHAVSAIVGVGRKQAVRTLIDLLNVESVEARREVMEALQRLTGEIYTEPSYWLRWWKANKDGF